MNRAVDYRTDMYSLGVTLYELFTGELPFQTGDSLEMIHSHIARQPTPPHVIDADLPRPVSDIILKLLAKNAEDRYQSARGLQADLRHCLAQLQATGQLKPFELGRDDFTGRLQIPQKLYGRQAEIDQLLAAFDRAIQGSAELLLVAGYAGVGKTSLVHEIHKSITAKRGYFIEGKFDQYQRSIPYFAWGQAFAELVNQWQTESETELARWRGAILDAVGQNGQVLVDIIPDLELVIGPQPEVPELDGIETQNRFNYLFQRFVRTVATPDHPLVVFLDDLQWIDLASLNLLKTLLTDPDSGYFLVIGAYRDNEVHATHSLMLGLNDLKEAGGTINQLTLGNLARADINQTGPQSNVDLRSILRASRAIAGELVLDKLLGKIMNIAMENAGAQRGCLMLEQGGRWRIEAAAEAGQPEPQLMKAASVAENDLLAGGIVNYVARTGQTVVLGRAAHEGEFTHDPYIQHKQVKSLLCMPLVNQGKTSGILYLENNLASNVFTLDRLNLLELLSSQMAMSIDYARLHANLEEMVQERTQALGFAEEQIRSLFESSPLGICLVTLDGDVQVVNQAFLRMTGYTEAEMRHFNVTSLYDDPKQRDVLLQQLQAGRSVRNFIVKGKRKNGTTMYVSLNMSKLTQSDQDAILAVVEDVSEQVWAEEALRESQSRLANILETAMDAFIIVNEDQLVIMINSAAEQMFGFEKANIVGRPLGQLMPGQFRRKHSDHFRAFGQTNVTARSMGNLGTVRGRRASGEEFPIEVSISQVKLSSETLYTAIVRDITERMQLEAQLQQVAATAERDRLARELHDAVTQTLFSASVVAEATPRIWLKDPAMAQQNMENLTLMLRGALAEMRTLLLELRPDVLRGQTLGQLLQTLVEAAQTRTSAPISLVVNGDRALPEDVTITFHRIAQESLNNVVKHADATEVSITLDCDQNGIVLRVCDNGRGFDPSTIPVGHFGLSIMAERIDIIGGALLIDGKPGDGTQIVVSWSE